MPLEVLDTVFCPKVKLITWQATGQLLLQPPAETNISMTAAWQAIGMCHIDLQLVCREILMASGIIDAECYDTHPYTSI